MPVLIEFPPQKDQVAFNLKRWEELSHDPSLADLGKRIETDRYGYVIMSMYPGGWHGSLEAEFSYLFRSLLGGTAVTECPISTSDGVKLADVGWFSTARYAEVRDHLAYPKAPEICVEIISPSNTQPEMALKRKLYFEAGCVEFWTCDRDGNVAFFDTPEGDAIKRSGLCAEFPAKVEV
jgi:Uma2 family endonuclease